jgi:uncharacterized RDD family membrane protein YckC
MIVAKNNPQLYARLPPRLQAFVRDMLVYIAITVIFLVVATLFPIQGVMTQTLVVAWLLALVLYEPLFVARAGGTIGHLSLNLRVVTASDLGPVSFPRAIVRAIVKAAVGIPVFLAVYFTAKHQGFHDLVAGTVVVPRDSSDIRSEWFAAERRRELGSAACRPRRGRVALWVHVLLSPWWFVWWASATAAVASGANQAEGTQVYLWAGLVVFGVGAGVWLKLLIDLVRWRREGRDVTWRYPIYWALCTTFSVVFAIVFLVPWVRRKLAPLEVGTAYAPVQ